jgi:hypothetical protein
MRLLLLFIFLGSTAAFAQTSIEQRALYEEFETNNLYVILEPGYSLGGTDINSKENSALNNFSELKALFVQEEIVKIQQEFKVLARKNVKFARIYRVTTKDGANLDQFVERMKEIKGIQLSEKIPLYSYSFVPNDPAYTDAQKRWHLDQIEADQAWDISQGCATVKIAIVDDAVMINHEDLQSNIYTNLGEIPMNGIDDDGNGYIDDVNGFDVADNDNNASPPSSATANYFSHGTHVAAIASGSTNNGVGTASIGFNSSIIPIKCKSNSSSNPAALTNPMQGVEYAIAAGADVINMSWGSYASSYAHQMVFEEADLLGIICVGAVGNDGLQFIAYPANYNTVLSVVATGTNDDLAFFTNFSEYTHIFAPGVDIWSGIATGTDQYGFKSGTSMASPLVSGIIALMLCNDPTLETYQIKNCITETADYIPSSALPGFSIPRVNAHQALQCVVPFINSCDITNCEMIKNGSFEIPSLSTITQYSQWGGAIGDGDLCSWEDYPNSVDCFPVQLSASNHFAHLQANIQNDSIHVYEGLVTKDILDLVPGKTYLLEFDYSVVKDSMYSIPDHFDSIAVKLVRNNWTQPFATYTIEDSSLLVASILDPPLDYIHPDWVPWLSNAVIPAQYFNHASLTFTIPLGASPTMKKIVIHPVSDFPGLPGITSTMGLCLDNISLKPVIDIVGSSSNYNPLPNDCLTLSSSTSASQVYWEPAYMFADPSLPTQSLCLDTMETCAGGTLEFTVTAMDPLIGCATTDTVVLNIQGVDTVAPSAIEVVLEDVFVCSAVDYLAPPAAWDNCDGTVSGITATPFPITQSTTVTWTYTDMNGNTFSQPQNVVLGGASVTTSVLNNVITANITGVTYQWFDCATNLLIPGETGQSFVPSMDGNYAVQVTSGTCVDSSECNSYYIGMEDLSHVVNLIVYPNPSSGMVTFLNEGGTIQNIQIFDLAGKIMNNVSNINTNEKVLNLEGLSKGIYIAEISIEGKAVRKRIVLK